MEEAVEINPVMPESVITELDACTVEAALPAKLAVVPLVRARR
jgi:hypothetical protein